MKEIIFEGYLYIYGWYVPQLSTKKNVHKSATCREFKLKVICQRKECVDGGAFKICGVQCRLIFTNSEYRSKKGTINSIISENMEELRLYVDSESVSLNNQNWWYNKRKSVATKGQIFILQNNEWQDVTDLPETLDIQKEYDDWRAEKQAKFDELLQEISQFNFTPDDKKKVHQGRTLKKIQEFVSTYKQLIDHSPEPQIIRHIHETAITKKYIQNKLPWLQFEYFPETIAAFKYYINYSTNEY